MTLHKPADAFPTLTVDQVGGRTFTITDVFYGGHGVVLSNTAVRVRYTSAEVDGE